MCSKSPITVLVLCLAFLATTSNARCRKARSGDIVHGANVYVFLEPASLGRIHGRLMLPGEEPARDAVVEIYKYYDQSDAQEPRKIPENRRRLAACLTDGQGRFSISQAKPGKYLLRAGVRQSSGLNAIHVVIVVDPRHRDSHAGLELMLSPGT